MLAGSRIWTLCAAEAATSAQATGHLVWLSDREVSAKCLPVSLGEKLLGSELDVLVYDAHSGFDPDSFGAALGALRGGGLLLLLTPDPDDWECHPDPQAARLAVHPFDSAQVSGRLIRRIARILGRADGVTLLSETDPISMLPPLGAASPAPPHEIIEDCRTPDQLRAVETICKTASGRARRPLVLTSDRGRGKSSALGIAAARRLASGPYNILVTAPRRSAVEPIFRHAARLLTNAEVHPNCISNPHSHLEFCSPDELCRASRTADLLLADEAAGIPAPLLEQMLREHPRVVFATTIHGYEGTGRGFEVRFRRTLDALTPGWRELRMETPIRWAPDDPLERLAARTLLLDATPAAASRVADAQPRNCQFRRLDRDTLADDEATLSQLFGLLVLAHYQTRPMDLRHLLDGPNVRVYVLLHEGQVAATALVAVEGGFERDLGRDIFEGRRRPRGHLLPQTLSAHAGLEEATGLRYARVIRIAVHPAAQGCGLGRSLLDAVADDARTLGQDLVGASFGATADLLEFWARCGFPPLHLGTSRNAASGAHAAVVLRPLSPAGEALQTLILERFGERLPCLLSGPLQNLEPEIAARLLREAPGRDWTPNPLERRELETFAYALRPYEAVLPLLARLAASRLRRAMCTGRLDDAERDALICKVLQHRDWGATARLLGLTGKARAVSLLRTATGKLVDG